MKKTEIFPFDTALYPPLVRVVDDDEEVRFSLSYSFRVAKIDCVTYASAREFLNKDDHRRPGCCVLDLTMPEMTGLELQAEMLERGIDLPVIFLSGNGDVHSAVTALQKGAIDFMEKPYKPARLRDRVKEMIEKNLNERREAARVADMRERFDSLTRREKLVIRYVAQDLINREIGEKLSIQEQTVKTHRSNGCNKLGAHSALEVYHLLQAIGEI